jgi:hypothetical protein
MSRLPRLSERDRVFRAHVSAACGDLTLFQMRPYRRGGAEKLIGNVLAGISSPGEVRMQCQDV